MTWRYDPIFIDDVYTMDMHFDRFNSMAGQLSGYTKTCVISFIDLYEKVKRNFPEIRQVSANERLEIGKEFSSIGKKYGIAIKTCAEGEAVSYTHLDVYKRQDKDVEN